MRHAGKPTPMTLPESSPTTTVNGMAPPDRGEVCPPTPASGMYHSGTIGQGRSGAPLRTSATRTLVRGRSGGRGIWLTSMSGRAAEGFAALRPGPNTTYTDVQRPS